MQVAIATYTQNMTCSGVGYMFFFFYIIYIFYNAFKKKKNIWYDLYN